MIFLVRSKMLSQFVDPLRENSDLHVSTASVFGVLLKGGGIDGGDFAHVSLMVNLRATCQQEEYWMG
jgi:hypothetical protein